MFSFLSFFRFHIMFPLRWQFHLTNLNSCSTLYSSPITNASNSSAALDIILPLSWRILYRFPLRAFPRYETFIILIVVNNTRTAFTLFNIASLFLVAVYDVLNILLCNYTWNASKRLIAVGFRVQVSALYNNIDQI